MPDHEKGGGKAVDRDHHRWHPGDGVAGDRSHIRIEAVQDISVPVPGDIAPPGVHDLVINIRLNIIADPDAELCRDAFDQVGKDQGRNRTGKHDHRHNPQLVRLISRNDIDQIFGSHAGDQPQGSGKDPDHRIEGNGPLIAGAVGKDPPPVIQDLGKSPLPQGIEEALV